MELIKRLMPKGHPYRPGRPMRDGRPRSVTVHWTANTRPGADALMHARYLEQTFRAASSWHYTVDAERVVQHVPQKEIAWHAGDGPNGDGNNTSIGVEVCVDPGSAQPGGPIRSSTLLNLVKLLAQLCLNYDWPADAVHIREHRDWTGKDCPNRDYINIVQVRYLVSTRLRIARTTAIPILSEDGIRLAEGRLIAGQTVVDVGGACKPVREVAAALGLGVQWDSERMAVVIITPRERTG